MGVTPLGVGKDGELLCTGGKSWHSHLKILAASGMFFYLNMMIYLKFLKNERKSALQFATISKLLDCLANSLTSLTA